jgi:hypothetical protein
MVKSISKLNSLHLDFSTCRISKSAVTSLLTGISNLKEIFLQHFYLDLQVNSNISTKHAWEIVKCVTDLHSLEEYEIDLENNRISETNEMNLYIADKEIKGPRLFFKDNKATIGCKKFKLIKLTTDN